MESILILLQVEPAHYEDFLTVAPQEHRTWSSPRSHDQRSRSHRQNHFEPDPEEYGNARMSRSHGHRHVREEEDEHPRSPRRSRKHKHVEEEIIEQPDLSIKRIQVESDDDLR